MPPFRPLEMMVILQKQLLLTSCAPAALLPRCPATKVPCYQGALQPRCPATKMPCYQSAVQPRCRATKVPCYQGALQPRCPATKVPCNQGVLLPRCPATKEGRYSSFRIRVQPIKNFQRTSVEYFNFSSASHYRSIMLELRPVFIPTLIINMFVKF